MYHGFPSSETIALVFGLIVWIIRGIAGSIKRLGNAKPDAVQAPPRSPGSPPPPGLQPPPPAPMRMQAPPPSPAPGRVQAPPLPQTLPARAPRLEPPRPRERQPAAGGPAVPQEATRRDFEQQEQELFASEPAALGTPLVSAPSRPAVQANSLFGSTDDLVRAIILQEVLGPPLSRRAAKTHQPPAKPVHASAPPQ